MPLMGKTEEDCNGLKLGFLKTVQPNSKQLHCGVHQLVLLRSVFAHDGKREVKN